MKILLINNNPVVSRLTALSARKEDVEIDEIQEVTELSSDAYDIVFVDSESWSKDVRDVISENIKTRKSVLFYADGDEEEKASFDQSILKPFLPSEVSAVIRSIGEVEVETTSNTVEENHFDIIGDAKELNRDELFSLDTLDEKEEKNPVDLVDPLNTENKEVSFDEKLEEAFPLKTNALDDDLFDNSPKVDLDLVDEIETKEVESEKVVEKPKDDLFDLDLNDDIPALDDNLFRDEQKEVDNKQEEVVEGIEKLELDDNKLESTDDLSIDTPKVDDPKEEMVVTLEDDLLELDVPEKVAEVKDIAEIPETTKVEEVVEVKSETQILDQLEIDKIKGILTEDLSDDMTLDDLMTPVPAMVTGGVPQEVSKETEELEEVAKVEEKIVPKASDVDAGVLAQTLAAMPVASLRELLAGATVKIEIKFPKSK